MTQHLTGTAEYQVEGDIILASIHLYDDVSQSYHPERVKRGTIKFIRGATTLLQRDFDARFGNGPPDGGFHFDLAHPGVSTGLSVKATVTLFDGDSLEVTLAVTAFSDESTVPLASQPNVSSTSYGLSRG